MIAPGRLYKFNGEEEYLRFKKDYGPSRHFTLVFNVFVFMQVFNMLNARKINDELCICIGCHKNYMYLGIWVFIFVIQVILTQFTQDVFQVARKGLAWHHWLITLGFSVSVVPLRFLILWIPDWLFCDLSRKKKIKKNKTDKDASKQKEVTPKDDKEDEKSPSNS